ncbi:mitochondrial inner membrane protease subunit 1 isoform X7 [Bos indicus x Bos taurus]|uniref:mitochondrial inner membrane protease subunit 1 isoform X7 n=1 Tax=Bos indicus x Bos taurus TaxID=30522 RepID=UPI000572E3D6|nr:mitochondrial inner membrane protease subunit 1 isoform X7 [Bos indicus x Bos taurus]
MRVFLGSLGLEQIFTLTGKNPDGNSLWWSKAQPFILLRPSMKWMRSAHMRKDSLLSLQIHMESWYCGSPIFALRHALDVFFWKPCKYCKNSVYCCKDLCVLDHQWSLQFKIQILSLQKILVDIFMVSKGAKGSCLVRR